MEVFLGPLDVALAGRQRPVKHTANDAAIKSSRLRAAYEDQEVRTLLSMHGDVCTGALTLKQSVRLFKHEVTVRSRR